MAKRQDFLEGFLRGLYQSGVGNPEVQRANELATSNQQATLNQKAAEQGLVTDNTFEQTHPMRAKIGGFISSLFGGASKPLNTAFKADPTQSQYAMGPNGEVSLVPPGQSIPEGQQRVNPGEGKTLLASQFKNSQDVWTPTSAVDSAGNMLLVNKKTGETKPIQGGFKSNSKPEMDPYTIREIAKARVALSQAKAVRNSAIPELERVRKLNKTAKGGYLGALETRARSATNFGTDAKSFTSTIDVVKSLKGQVASILKSTFGAQLSNEERTYLQELYGAAEKLSNKERDIAIDYIERLVTSKLNQSQSVLSDLTGEEEAPSSNDPLGLNL